MTLHPTIAAPGCHLSRGLASAQAEALVDRIAAHWLHLPKATRRLVLATVSNPAYRSDDLLLAADILREFATLAAQQSMLPAARRMALAATEAANALAALAPSRI